MAASPDGLEGCQGAVVGVGEPAEVLLGGLDLLVAEAIHHCFEVCPAGQQPRGCAPRSSWNGLAGVTPSARSRAARHGCGTCCARSASRCSWRKADLRRACRWPPVFASVLAELVADPDGAVFLVLGVVAHRRHLVGAGDLLGHLEHDAADVDLAGLQVDIHRTESRKLAPSDAGLDRDQDQDPVPLRNLVEQVLEPLG